MTVMVSTMNNVFPNIPTICCPLPYLKVYLSVSPFYPIVLLFTIFLLLEVYPGPKNYGEQE